MAVVFGRELPPRDPFIQNALEKRRQCDHPQEHDAVSGAGHRDRDRPGADRPDELLAGA